MAKPKSKPFRKPITYKKTLDEYTGPVTNNGGLGKRTVNNGIRGRGAYDKRSGQFRGVKWSSTPLAGSQTVQIGSGTASKPAVKKTAAKKTVAKPAAKPAVKKTATKTASKPISKKAPTNTRSHSGLSPKIIEFLKATGQRDPPTYDRSSARPMVDLNNLSPETREFLVATGQRGIATPVKTASKPAVKKAPAKTPVPYAIGPTTNIRAWYMKTYPTDELGAEIEPTLTFASVWAGMRAGKDFYNMVSEADSIVRERIFEGISKVHKIPYDAVYEVWINQGEKKPAKQSPFNDPHISIVRPAITLQSGKDDGARILGLLKTTERYVMDLDDGPAQTFQAAKAGQIMINAGRAYASKRSPANKTAFTKAFREFLIEIQKSDAFYILVQVPLVQEFHYLQTR